jgi:hypothetical protein
MTARLCRGTARALPSVLALLCVGPPSARAEPMLVAVGPQKVVRQAAEASVLPIPPALPSPALPDDVHLPAGDPAQRPATLLRKRARKFPNLRAETPGAVWVQRDEWAWSVRTARECLAQLRALGVPHRPVGHRFPTPVAVPVALTGDVHGVRFVNGHPEREFAVACELAVRLPALADLLRSHGVAEVVVASAYRDHPQVSFHTFGLALDLAAFEVNGERLQVEVAFEPTPDAITCAAKPQTPAGRTLLAIACDLAASGLFSSVLTPNYNAGHRDHMHIDMRPDDPRFFVR